MLWASTASPDWGSGLSTAADRDSVSVSRSSAMDSFASPISACI